MTTIRQILEQLVTDLHDSRPDREKRIRAVRETIKILDQKGRASIAVSSCYGMEVKGP